MSDYPDTRTFEEQDAADEANADLAYELVTGREPRP